MGLNCKRRKKQKQFDGVCGSCLWVDETSADVDELEPSPACTSRMGSLMVNITELPNATSTTSEKSGNMTGERKRRMAHGTLRGNERACEVNNKGWRVYRRGEALAIIFYLFVDYKL